MATASDRSKSETMTKGCRSVGRTRARVGNRYSLVVTDDG